VTFSAHVAWRERLHLGLADRRPILRLLAFSAIAAFIIVGPFYEQVLGQSTFVFRSWRMYSTRGLGVIDAKFYELAENGELRRELSRGAVAAALSRLQRGRQTSRPT
jgi:hypothetical protein